MLEKKVHDLVASLKPVKEQDTNMTVGTVARLIPLINRPFCKQNSEIYRTGLCYVHGGELATVRSRTPQLQPSFNEASCTAKNALPLCCFALFLYLFDVDLCAI